MAFIPIPNCVQVLVNATILGQEVQNVYHVASEASGDPIQLDDICDVFIDWAIAELVPIVSDQVTYRSVVATDQAVASGAQVTKSFPPATEGDQVSPAMPSGVSVAVSWRTGFSGRSFRGRTFHFGFVESQVDGNEVAGATLASLVGAYAQLVTDCATEGFPLSVASRYTGGAPRTEGIITTILSVLIDPNIDSQRRRLAGRGR